MHLELPYGVSEISFPLTIDSSLKRLESLVLIEIPSSIFWSLLLKLTCLPRLFSLTIKFADSVTDLTGIYQKIFALPVLKYYKYSIRNSNASLFLPIATEKEFSSIEYLVIDHDCNFEQLALIISYTPQLVRLNFTHIDHNLVNNEIILPIKLTNITHLSLCIYMKFDEFELLINEIYSKLKFFSFTSELEDIDYLDGNRWEKLILKKFPKLEKFYFKYYETIDHVNRSPGYLDKQNHFISSFWTERKWSFEVEMQDCNIIFSIRPYKKQWYEYELQHKIVDSSTQFSKSGQLTITLIDDYEYLIMDINRILTLTQIYHFEISEENLFIGILFHIINSLGELTSLKIVSLSSRRSEYMTDDEFVPLLYSTSYKSKITKVYLRDMTDIEHFYMVLYLCPYMEYLEVDYINNSDIEVFLQVILKKINRDHNKHLRSLCFHVLVFDDDDQDDDNNNNDEEMTKKLETIINSKKLLMNYTIRRVVDNIYLEWK